MIDGEEYAARDGAPPPRADAADAEEVEDAPVYSML